MGGFPVVAQAFWTQIWHKIHANFVQDVAPVLQTCSDTLTICLSRLDRAGRTSDCARSAKGGPKSRPKAVLTWRSFSKHLWSAIKLKVFGNTKSFWGKQCHLILISEENSISGCNWFERCVSRQPRQMQCFSYASLFPCVHLHVSTRFNWTFCMVHDWLSFCRVPMPVPAFAKDSLFQFQQR